MKKAPYKLIAIDFDGTLLCPEGTVRPRVKKAVHRALAAGLLVCFATGRAFADCGNILESVDHYGTAVFVSGAVVMDTRNRVTLHRTMMDPELARQVSGRIEALGIPVLALQEQSPDGVDYLVTSGLELNEPTQRWLQWNQTRVQFVPTLAEHTHGHTMRVSISASPELCAVAERDLLETFGTRVVIHNLGIGDSHEMLEILDPAVSKWEGIRHIARAHGIEDGEIIAIGDDMNDLPMIRNAGLGVAMGNAREPIRRAARRIIGTNHEEGLAAFIEELLEQHQVQPLSKVDADAAETRSHTDAI